MADLRFKYQTIVFGDDDIHVRTLKDKQQFSDDDHVAENLGISSAVWPLFGVIWPSGELLAHLMHSFQVEGKKILEIGCGIGLASLVLNQRHADITATDYHPEAGGFLKVNTLLNEGDRIPFIRAGWEDEYCSLGQFDLIIGSDLLYEREHTEKLSLFIDRHAETHCEVILIDPGRGQHNRFAKAMEGNGYTHNKSVKEAITNLSEPFNGRVMRFVR